MDKPTDYKQSGNNETIPEIKVEKYSGNIHFLGLKHIDDKILVVAFSDFFLVEGVPINSVCSKTSCLDEKIQFRGVLKKMIVRLIGVNE